MLEDQKLMRLLAANQQAIASMTHMQQRRTAGHDRVRLDVEHGWVAYVRGSSTQWKPRAELIGILMTDIERWRWWWVLPGAEVGSEALRLNAAYAIGQREGIDTLTSRNPNVAQVKDAVVLSQLCAVLAGAQGVHAERGDDRVTYYALFDAESAERAPAVQQYSTMLPPSSPPSQRVGRLGEAPGTTGTKSTKAPSQPARAPLHSVFPGALPPGTNATDRGFGEKASVQAPDRTLVRTLAHCALQMMRDQLPGGFRQAVVTVYVDVRGGKLRFSAQLVASDKNADLVVLDPSPQMMQAVEELVTADVRSGNGRWTRLTIRLLATATGASLDVQVKE